MCEFSINTSTYRLAYHIMMHRAYFSEGIDHGERLHLLHDETKAAHSRASTPLLEIPTSLLDIAEGECDLCVFGDLLGIVILWRELEDFSSREFNEICIWNWKTGKLLQVLVLFHHQTSTHERIFS